MDHLALLLPEHQSIPEEHQDHQELEGRLVRQGQKLEELREVVEKEQDHLLLPFLQEDHHPEAFHQEAFQEDHQEELIQDHQAFQEEAFLLEDHRQDSFPEEHHPSEEEEVVQEHLLLHEPTTSG